MSILIYLILQVFGLCQCNLMMNICKCHDIDTQSFPNLFEDRKTMSFLAFSSSQFSLG